MSRNCPTVSEPPVLRIPVSLLIITFIAGACAPRLQIMPAPAVERAPRLTAADTLRPWQLLKQGEVRLAEQLLSRLPLDTSAHIAAAQGILSLWYGDWELAEERLRPVLNCADTLLAKFAYQGLSSILALKEQYAALESLEARAQAERWTQDSTNYLAARFLRQAGPMQLSTPSTATRLPMKRTIVNCPAGPVRVNGGALEDFWFDTGASMNVISEDLARKYHVRIFASQAGETRTATPRRVKVRFGVIDSLELGAFTLRNVPVAVMSGRDLSMGVPFLRIPGIIGWPVIARFRTTFDYPRRLIHLAIPAETTGRLRNLFFAGIPVVEVRVNGSGPLNFLLDTGAAGSLLTHSGWARLDPPPPLSSAVGCLGGAGGSDVGSLRLVRGAALTVASHTLQPLTLQLHSLPVEELPIGIDGLLGEDVLRHFVVTIDARHGQLILE